MMATEYLGDNIRIFNNTVSTGPVGSPIERPFELLTERNATTVEEFNSLSFHDLVHADVYSSSTPELAVWLRTERLDDFRHQVVTTIAEIESQHAAHKAGIGALGLKDEAWVKKAASVKARYQCRMVEVKELVRKRNIEDQASRHTEEALLDAIREHRESTYEIYGIDEDQTEVDVKLWSYLPEAGG